MKNDPYIPKPIQKLSSEKKKENPIKIKEERDISYWYNLANEAYISPHRKNSKFLLASRDDGLIFQMKIKKDNRVQVQLEKREWITIKGKHG